MQLSPVSNKPGHNGNRLAWQFGAAVAFAMLVAGAISLFVAESRISALVDAELIKNRDILLEKDSGGATDPKQLATRIADLQQARVIKGHGYVLFDGEGRRIAGQLEIATPHVGYSDMLFHDGGLSLRRGRVLATMLPGGGKLAVVEHSEVREDIEKTLLPISLALIAAAALAGFVASILFTRQIAVRLAKTQATADAIAKGNLSHRLQVEPRDRVFAEQALSLNRMLDRMEDMVKSQRHLARNLAHDLRTPLTRLHGLLAEDSNGSAHHSEQVIERARRECGSIMSIFDALLRLSEIEAGRHPAAMQPLALKGMVEDVADTMEPVMADNGRKLSRGALDDLHIRGDAGLINQLLINLLENIAHHTPVGTQADISVRRSGNDDSVIIAIADDGPGIPAHEMERVGEPFQRGGATIASGAKGSGLGLAIASAIVRFHDGKIELTDNRPGLIVRLLFPIVSPEEAAPAA